MTARQQISGRPVTAWTPSFTPVRRGLLQRKCACGGTPGPTGECEQCRKKRQGLLQRRAATQPSTFDPQPSEVPPIVHEVLRSPGQPLDLATRASMEPRFGHDFSRVRVHTDSKAAESARAVNALAYTVGRDVVFGTGQYAPGMNDGQRILAHELTHVMQQRGNVQTLQGQSRMGAENSSYEQEADAAAQQVLHGGRVSVPSVISSGTLQRAMICSKPLDFRLAAAFGARHSFIDDTGRNDCLGTGIVGNYAVTDLVSGNFVRGCAAKTDRSPDPRGKTPVGKPCKPKSGVTDVSRCLRDSFNRYADPSLYSNEAVTAGAAGGAVVGGIIGGFLGAVGGAVGGARLTSRVNGPNSNTFAATLARDCCENSSSSGLGWVPGWDHAPATPCPGSRGPVMTA